MNAFTHVKLSTGFALVLTLAMARPASADPWEAFVFGTANTPAASFIFTGSGLLLVTDAFRSGDRFEVFDNLVSLGSTSLPLPGAPGTFVDCGSDPVNCFEDPSFSHGVFPLGGGEHAIRINVTDSPFGGGDAYFCIQGPVDCGVGVSVPEPSTMALFGIGLIVLALRFRRRAQHSSIQEKPGHTVLER